MVAQDIITNTQRQNISASQNYMFLLWVVVVVLSRDSH